jgi:hypothetical protein
MYCAHDKDGYVLAGYGEGVCCLWYWERVSAHVGRVFVDTLPCAHLTGVCPIHTISKG